MCLIKFNSFSFRYKKNEVYQLNNINLKINENKFILLAGETGSGKTTLIRSMNGLIPQFYAGFYKGSIEVNGKDTVETPIADLSTEIGIVFQNPENQLISMNVEHEIAFGMENLGVPREEMVRKINKVVKLTEIEHLLDKAPFELSGGEQQRVAIASILVLEPKVLILDEPTALLDPYMAEKIIKLLKRIQTKKKTTIIIAEHRLDLIIPFVDEIILINDGKIVEHDTKENAINGNNFQNLNVNKPVLYSIIKQLKKEKFYNDKIPTSVPEVIEYFKNIK
ncbi:MAG: energy-coupling factor ABC transporter ATP-binding protein [Candidatus Thorarchaeota archaeon]